MPSMTITTTAEQAQRLATAFGKAHGLTNAAGQPRAATASEIKDFTTAWMRKIVLDQERLAAALAAVDANFEPT